jgi:hypothetical protein
MRKGDCKAGARFDAQDGKSEARFTRAPNVNSDELLSDLTSRLATFPLRKNCQKKWLVLARYQQVICGFFFFFFLIGFFPFFLASHYSFFSLGIQFFESASTYLQVRRGEY